MPQATPELRAKFPGSEPQASKVLVDAGYVLTDGWEWVKPIGREPTQREWDAIDYLVYEWDFGGMIEDTNP